MNCAIILAGGIGTRISKEKKIPKQYIMLKDKTIIEFSLIQFQNHPLITKIVIVADEKWHLFIGQLLEKNKINKFNQFAEPGRTRQISIYNALKVCQKFMNEDGLIIIHDAARPFVDQEIINKVTLFESEFDGVMPAVRVKDTIYESSNEREVSFLLDRQKLFAGQTPESFKFGKYLRANEAVTLSELEKINGSTEIAILSDLKMKLVQGNEKNFKITTQSDLEHAECLLKGKK